MKLGDLVGHKILGFSGDIDLIIKTDKGVYTIDTDNRYPDGTLASVSIEESDEETWKFWSRK